MTVWFVDGSKIEHSLQAKVSCDKSKNTLYVNDNDEEYTYHLDAIKQVDLE